MDCLYICNTSSGNISKVSLERFREEKKITLYSETDESLGPHGIFIFKENIYVANSYGNSLSVIDGKSDCEKENYYIGEHPSDVLAVKDKVYILCSLSNSLVIFDLLTSRIAGEIKVGTLPQSLDLFKDKLLVSNMESDTLSIVNIKKNKEIKTIKVGPYPTKAIYSPSGKTIIVCESNLGGDSCGSISFVDAGSCKVMYRVKVGKIPINLYANHKFCFVSNFGEGTISVINLLYKEETKRINIGGAPSGIIRDNKNLYVTDNYNNKLIRINLFNMEIKKVSIGGEPGNMIKGR